MEKAIELSNSEKSLIWNRFIEPAKGTQEEAQHFISVCENFGLNPLLGDIVFQRYETKRGAKTQFITTRDGLLRVATRQPGYVGAPIANVVKQGDDFEFLPSEGTVKHKFGTKRGEILGAYAIMQHKKHNPVAVFVDFQEYFNANSGKQNSRYGNANVWDTLPSAMIVKIAETFVLRRQFPLGGLYTKEEMGLGDDLPVAEQGTPSQSKQASPQAQSSNENKRETSQPTKEIITRELIVKSFEVKTSSSKKSYGLLIVQEKGSDQDESVLVRGTKLMESLKNTSEGDVLQLAVYKENGFHFLESYKQSLFDDKQEYKQNQKAQQTEQAEQQSQSEANENQKEEEQTEQSKQTASGGNHQVMIQNVTFGEKSSKKFAKITGVMNDDTQLILARGDEQVEKAEELEQGDAVTLTLKEENGFFFLVDVVNQSQQVG